MRPKYLEMSAWGPYKDVVKVDFEAFDKGALFLITGPTGSGKTTISAIFSRYLIHGERRRN